MCSLLIMNLNFDLEMSTEIHRLISQEAMYVGEGSKFQVEENSKYFQIARLIISVISKNEVPQKELRVQTSNSKSKFLFERSIIFHEVTTSIN